MLLVSHDSTIFGLPKGTWLHPGLGLTLSIMAVYSASCLQGRGERAYDIFSRLLKERIICLMGPVSNNVSLTLISKVCNYASFVSCWSLGMGDYLQLAASY